MLTRGAGGKSSSDSETNRLRSRGYSTHCCEGVMSCPEVEEAEAEEEEEAEKEAEVEMLEMPLRRCRRIVAW